MDVEQVTTKTQSVSMPIQKSVSADDLLDMYDEEPRKEAEEVSKEVSKQAKIAQELPKKLVADKVVKSLESKGDTDEEASESSSAESESEGKEQEEEVENLEAKVPVPSFKAKVGDTELEIPEEATITHAVNGKPFQIKVKDAVKALVGQEEWNRKLDQRVSHLNNKEKEHFGAIERIKTTFKEVAEKAETGDHMSAIKLLAQMAGKDPVEYEQAVLSKLTRLGEVYGKMSEEQRKLYFAERKAEQLSKDKQALESERQRSLESQQVYNKVMTLCKQHNLSEDQFRSYMEELVTDFDMKPEEMVPEDVITHHLETTHAKKVGSAIGKVDPKLADDDSFVEQILLNTKDSPEFTVDDIADIVREVKSVESKSVENLKRKVEKAGQVGFRAQPTKGSSDGKKANSDVDEDAYDFFFGKAKLSPRR